MQFKGLTVGALRISRVHFMRADQNMFERTIIFVVAMIRALFDYALNALVGLFGALAGIAYAGHLRRLIGLS